LRGLIWGKLLRDLTNNWQKERRPTMKEGDIFENLLDGMEYVVKNIVNSMVVLQSIKGDRQILTEVETLKIKSFYQAKEKRANFTPFRQGLGQLLQFKKRKISDRKG